MLVVVVELSLIWFSFSFLSKLTWVLQDTQLIHVSKMRRKAVAAAWALLRLQVISASARFSLFALPASCIHGGSWDGESSGYA